MGELINARIEIGVIDFTKAVLRGNFNRKLPGVTAQTVAH